MNVSTSLSVTSNGGGATKSNVAGLRIYSIINHICIWIDTTDQKELRSA